MKLSHPDLCWLRDQLHAELGGAHVRCIYWLNRKIRKARLREANRKAR